MHILSYLLCAIWLAMLIGAFVECYDSKNQRKAAWFAIIVLVPFLGAYLFFTRAQGREISEL